MSAAFTASALLGGHMTAHKKGVYIFICVQKSILVKNMGAFCHEHACKAVVLRYGNIAPLYAVCNCNIGRVMSLVDSYGLGWHVVHYMACISDHCYRYIISACRFQYNLLDGTGVCVNYYSHCCHTPFNTV